MNYRSSRFAKQLTPFLMLGVSVAFLFAVLMMLSYVLVWGLIVGVALWSIVRIKLFFTQSSSSLKTQSGQVIDIIEYSEHGK